jgi:hypothetical protein
MNQDFGENHQVTIDKHIKFQQKQSEYTMGFSARLAKQRKYIVKFSKAS